MQGRKNYFSAGRGRKKLDFHPQDEKSFLPRKKVENLFYPKKNFTRREREREREREILLKIKFIFIKFI